MKQLKDVLVDARKKAKLTQEKLAGKFGCDRSSISNMETGRIPLSVAMMIAYNEFLGVDINLLKELTSEQKNTRGQEKLKQKFKIAEKLATYERQDISPTLQSLMKECPELEEALRDPWIRKTVLGLHKNKKDIKEFARILESFPNMPKEKQKAILTLLENSG